MSVINTCSVVDELGGLASSSGGGGGGSGRQLQSLLLDQVQLDSLHCLRDAAAGGDLTQLRLLLADAPDAAHRHSLLHLACLTSLVRLHVSVTPTLLQTAQLVVDGPRLAALASGCRALRCLSLSGLMLLGSNGSGVRHLQQLSRLTSLRLLDKQAPEEEASSKPVMPLTALLSLTALQRLELQNFEILLPGPGGCADSAAGVCASLGGGCDAFAGGEGFSLSLHGCKVLASRRTAGGPLLPPSAEASDVLPLGGEASRAPAVVTPANASSIGSSMIPAYVADEAAGCALARLLLATRRLTDLRLRNCHGQLSAAAWSAVCCQHQLRALVFEVAVSAQAGRNGSGTDSASPSPDGKALRQQNLSAAASGTVASAPLESPGLTADAAAGSGQTRRRALALNSSTGKASRLGTCSSSHWLDDSRLASLVGGSSGASAAMPVLRHLALEGEPQSAALTVEGVTSAVRRLPALRHLRLDVAPADWFAGSHAAAAASALEDALSPLESLSLGDYRDAAPAAAGVSAASTAVTRPRAGALPFCSPYSPSSAASAVRLQPNDSVGQTSFRCSWSPHNDLQEW